MCTWERLLLHLRNDFLVRHWHWFLISYWHDRQCGTNEGSVAARYCSSAERILRFPPNDQAE